MAKWIRFDLLARDDPKRKTDQWHVVSTSAIGVLLGRISWYGSWRKYCFFPNRGLDLVFEQDCLRDIGQFIEEETGKYRRSKLAERTPEKERKQP